MSTTRIFLSPKSADFPASAYAQLSAIFNRKVIAFDASVEESIEWTFRAAQGLTGPLTLECDFIMASAVANSIVLGATVEAVTPGDAVDLDSADSFASTNNSSAVTVPGTAGYLARATITLTNDDGIAAGDLVRVKISRKVSDGGDTATGDLYLLGAELRDAA